MCFWKELREKERNSRKNERKNEREGEKRRINLKWKSGNGTRVLLNATWMYVLYLLQLYIRPETT